MRSIPFWALLVVFTTPPLFGNLATSQHALYFPARGFSAAETSLMLAAGGVLAASGRVLAGLVADRFGAAVAGFASFSVSAAGVLCLLGMETWPSRVFRLRLRALSLPALGLAGNHRLGAARAHRRSA